MTPGPIENPEPEVLKPFLAGLSGAFTLPAGDSLEVASPFAGCDLSGEWKMINLSPLYHCLALSGGYIYHPKAEKAEYLENYHLLNSNLGIKLGFAFSSTVPISFGLILSGGVTVSIIESTMYTETLYLFNPNVCTQIDFQYNLGETYVLMVKTRYLAVIGGGSFNDWYHEISAGVGMGIRF